MRYSKEKIKELTGIDIDDDYGYIDVVEEKKYKTLKQTRAFHALLGCFWKSGCSSFPSYDFMRCHYKETAHLIEVLYRNDLKTETKNMLWKAIKLLPLDTVERVKTCELLKGRVLKERSWSECSKEMATIAMQQLIDDMFASRVDDSPQAKKFKEILDGMSQYDEGYFR